MSFANLPALAALFGVAALAGILYLLQRLRVRHREQTVVTTLFWREAVEETRARVFMRRFRHPWAYLLVLLIAALLWLSIAEPRIHVAKDQQLVVLLDGSAVMGREDLFEQAAQKVEELCKQLPQAQRVVLLSQSTSQTLLAPRENIELLKERLRDVQPQPCPSHIEQHIRDALGGIDHRTKAKFIIVSAASPSSDFVDQMRSTVTLHHVAVSTKPEATNAGITNLGLAAARSASWDRVDVLIEVAGAATRPEIEVRLNDKAIPQGTTERTAKGFRFRFRDVPAQGGKLTARLNSDGFTLDDQAAVVLPDRSLIRVAIAPDVNVAIAARFRQLFAVDNALQVDASNPEVVIRNRGDGFGGSATAFELSPIESQPDAFLVGHESRGDAAVLLRISLAQLGLDQIDARGIAQQTGRKISLGVEPTAKRRLRVWQDLLSSRFNFVDSAAFPVFAGKTIRWLAGRRPVNAVSAAGEPLAGMRGAYRQQNRKLETGGVDFVPPHSGSFRDSITGQEFEVSLLDEGSTLLSTSENSKLDNPPGVWSGNLISWIGLLAFGLLVTEWFVYHRGTIP